MTDEDFTDIARRYPEAFHKVVALMQTEGGNAIIEAIVKRGGFNTHDPAFPRNFRRKPGWKYRVYNLGPCIARPIAGFDAGRPLDIPEGVARKAIAEGRMSGSFMREAREIPAQILVGEGDYTGALAAIDKSVRWVGTWLKDRAPVAPAH